MPPKADALQARIDYLSHELEMYTFVNKGVLQSNNEYKLRIAELERENAVLSTAERNLTATEDALEACERALKDLEKERDALAFRLKREEIARKGAERERDIWKGWFEDLEGAWGVADKAMKGALARKGQESKEEERAKVSVGQTRRFGADSSVTQDQAGRDRADQTGLERRPDLELLKRIHRWSLRTSCWLQHNPQLVYRQPGKGGGKSRAHPKLPRRRMTARN